MAESNIKAALDLVTGEVAAMQKPGIMMAYLDEAEEDGETVPITTLITGMSIPQAMSSINQLMVSVRNFTRAAAESKSGRVKDEALEAAALLDEMVGMMGANGISCKETDRRLDS